MCRHGLSTLENRKGLVVLAATTWLNMLVYAPLMVFAILFVALEEEFKASTTAIGEIGSVTWAVFNLSTPLPTFMMQKWGARFVIIIGILMLGGGLFLCTFSNEIWMLFLFYGVVQGLGLCFIQTVTTQLLTSFFSGSALVRAFSFAAIGETVGMFALSPIFAIGVTTLGWRIVCQISSCVIIALCLPTCYVFDNATHAHIPPEAEEIQSDCSKEKRACKVLQKYEIRPVRKKHLAHTMRIPGIWIFSVATIFYVLCMAFVMIGLVEIFVVQGQSITDSAWFVTIFAISQTAGKVLNIIMGNRLCISNMKLLVLMCIIGGMMSLGMVYWEGTILYMFAYSIVNGLIRGNVSSRNLPAAIELFGQKTSPILINCVYISVGIAFLSASLVSGLSYDLTGSYRSAHISIFVFWLLAAILLLPLAFKWPSFIFKPWFCYHRDYTQMQSRENSHKNMEATSRVKREEEIPSDTVHHETILRSPTENESQHGKENGQLTVASILLETSC